MEKTPVARHNSGTRYISSHLPERRSFGLALVTSSG